MTGYLSLVVVAHAPYLRYHGRDPVGEDALHTTIAEVLLPLLHTLHELRDANLSTPIGLACSPVLLEQLADPVVQKHFVLWIERWLGKVEADRKRWQIEDQNHLLYLAQFYLEWGQTILASFQARYRRNLVVALRELCEAGQIEPLLLPATNARLDEITSEIAVRAQIEVAMFNTVRHLGQRPRGLWLSHGYHVGLEHIARGAGLHYLIMPEQHAPGQMAGWLLGRRMAALLRDRDLEQQIMSADLGYPGDPLYRESGASAGSDELCYRRNRLGDWDAAGDWYDPYHAFQRAQEHAEHFVRFARHSQHSRATGAQAPLLLVGYHPGLGKRRWFEGMTWLRGMLEAAAYQSDLTIVTPGEYLRRHPPRKMIQPVASARDTTGVAAQRLAQATARIVELAEHVQDDDPLRERLLNQASRELLLAQDSAWSELEPDAAAHQLRQHLDCFTWLSDRAVQPVLSAVERAELELIEDQHAVFPLLNYRMFEGGVI